MKNLRKFKRSVATLLATAMLITNFTSTPVVFATQPQIDEEVIDSVVFKDNASQQEETTQGVEDDEQDDVVLENENSETNDSTEQEDQVVVDEEEKETEESTEDNAQAPPTTEEETETDSSVDDDVQTPPTVEEEIDSSTEEDGQTPPTTEENEQDEVGKEPNHESSDVEVPSTDDTETPKDEEVEAEGESTNPETDKEDITEPVITETATLTIHYNRKQGDYEGWNVYTWFAGAVGVELVPDKDFGAVTTIEVPVNTEIEYIIRKSIEGDDWADKNHGDNQKITITQDTEIWVTQGQNGYHETRPELDPVDETDVDLIIHYERQNKDYDGWQIWTWGTGQPDAQVKPIEQDEYGAVLKVTLPELEQLKSFGFKFNQNDWAVKDGGDKKIDVEQLNVVKNVDRYVAHVYVKEGSDTIHYTNPNKEIGDYSTVTVHYQRPEQDYAGWNLWLWNTNSPAEGRLDFQYKDEHSYIAEFKVKTGNEFGYILRKSVEGNDWADKNHAEDQSLKVYEDTEIWINPGQNGFDAVGPSGDRVELGEEYYQDPVSDEDAQLQVFIHYYRYLDDYRTWNVWGWAEGKEGHAYSFKSDQTDDFGRYAKINLKDIEGVDQLGFIIRKGEWTDRDGNTDRFIDLSNPVLNEETGKLEVHAYVLQGDQVVYDKPDVDKTPPLEAAHFTNLNKLSVKSPTNFTDTLGVSVKNANGEDIGIKAVELSQDSTTLNVTLNQDIEMGETYYIAKEGYKGETYIEYYGLFDTKEFEDLFTYQGNDLGATYKGTSTAFRVWAPTASSVTLKLYKDGHTDSHLKDVIMKKDVKGTWVTTGNENLEGVYYTYEVTVGNQTNEAVDPYAQAVGVNGLRAMVVNLDETDPSRWPQDVDPEFSGNITDAIIYELHMRDLSSHASSGIENVGKYLQFTENGTTNKNGDATGIDHLVEMGITHLHLLPAFDHRSIDETRLNDPQFNWGYDPQHYNVPEGSYSTDPYNGAVRINEFKQMVQALHDNEIRVVMDVVYNHTGATADSDFNKIVPGYYYRQDDKGGFANGSGCGNETASERSMMRKFIIDSVTYWAQEYNINGFRFDLMALHDIDTMNAVVAALHEIDPTIIVYGEGWQAGGSPLPGEESAIKHNAKQTPEIAYFNDDMRDGIKGRNNAYEGAGYINGDLSMYERTQFGIVGSAYHNQVSGWGDWAANPSQSISYVSAHDNYTLYDKLYGHASLSGTPDMAYIKQLQKQSNAFVLLGQGVPFLHAGVEMMRSKDGEENSYNAPDEINQMDWNLKTEHADVVEYYKGLIELRKAHPAFRMMSQADVQANLKFDEVTPKHIMSYTISNHANGDSVSDIAVLHNVSGNVETGYLPIEGEWSMVVNGEHAGTEVIEVINGRTFEMQPHSSYVLMLNYDAPVKDTQAPVITLNGEKEITLTVGEAYKELGAKAVDNVDGEIDVQISGEVNTEKVGTYKVTYEAVDKAGNKATATRNIIVKEAPVVDKEAPVITLNGDSEITLTVGEAYKELGAKAVDNVDKEVDVKISGEVDTEKVGTYKVTYEAVDKAGNKATATRHVIVKEAPVVDKEAPVITLNGDDEITLTVGQTYYELGAKAIDNVDKEVDVKISGEVNTEKAGTYKVTYEAQDKAGNKAKATRTVIVTKASVVDKEAPVITLNGDAKITLTVGDVYKELGAKAIDSVDGEVDVKMSGEVNTEKAGTYHVTYETIDKAGNKATLTRTIIVKEKETPNEETTYEDTDVFVNYQDESVKIEKVGQTYQISNVSQNITKIKFVSTTLSRSTETATDCIVINVKLAKGATTFSVNGQEAVNGELTFDLNKESNDYSVKLLNEDGKAVSEYAFNVVMKEDVVNPEPEKPDTGDTQKPETGVNTLTLIGVGSLLLASGSLYLYKKRKQD